MTDSQSPLAATPIDTEAIGSGAPSGPSASETMSINQTVLKDRTGPASSMSPHRISLQDRCADCISVVCSFHAINLVFFLAGVSVVVIGLVAHEWRVVELDLCRGCKHLANTLVVMGALLMVWSLVGLYVSLRRKALLLLAYLVILFLLFVGVVGVTTAVLVMDSNGYHMQDGWKELVAGDPTTVCDIQREHKCSGWDTCCGFPMMEGGNVTESEQNVTSLCSWDAAECVAACPSEYTKGCDHPMRDSLRLELIPFTIVASCGLLLMLLGVCSLMRLKKKPKREMSYLELEN